MDIQTILKNVTDDKRMKVAVTDIDGILRGKFLHPAKFHSVLEGGFGFCDVVLGWDMADTCYDNVSLTGWHSGYPDAHVRLDPTTFRRIPWNNDLPFVLGEFVLPDGKPHPVCPRQLLKSVRRYAESLGYTAHFGMEFEWFNFLETPTSLHEKGFRDMKPLTPGMFGYSMLRTSLNDDIYEQLMAQLESFGVPLEGLHTETGPGVLEAALMNTEALEAADRAVLFKSATKEILYRHGVVPTFMAKWNAELPGSSGHMHQSLWKDGVNAFYDESDPLKMSDTFRHYLAGQVALLPEILPMFAPTVNSFKRLVEGMWAPTRVTWGADNRTVALRVIPGSAKSTRLETRVGGADLNPYLGIAAALAAGLYGIENKLPLDTERVVGNGYEAEAIRLPSSLDAAAKAMSASDRSRTLFGSDFVDHFVNTRLWEQRQYAAAVTDWELARYFELV